MAKCLDCTTIYAVFGGSEGSECPTCKSKNIDTSAEKANKPNPDHIYKLRGVKHTTVLVEVLAVGDWDVTAKRLDTGVVDTYPIMYFKKNFTKEENTK